MAQFGHGGDYAGAQRSLDDPSPNSFETALQDSSGRVAFNALLINQADLPDEYVCAIPEHLLVPPGYHAQTMQGGFDPDILSASKYPDLFPTSESIPRRSERRYTQPSGPDRPNIETNPFGGYGVIEETGIDNTQMARDDTNGEKPAKKRSKKNAKSDEDETIKKQRGRPRLDTRDETAADRRRTQIRLAQRAYRQRKETTITALNKRVKELESTIDEMNKCFLRFNDNAISSGLLRSKPELAQQLRSTAERFLNLAKTATVDSDHDGKMMEEIFRESSPSASPGNAPFSDSRRRKHDARLDRPLGYEVTYEDDLARSNSPARNASPDQDVIQTSSADLPSWRIMNTYQQYNVQIPEVSSYPDPATLPIERPLKPSSPYTYSFQETTFARRLHRACLERAFRLLTNPAADQEELSRAFRFTFCFSDKKRMLLRFQELLKRGAGESLENWNAPFFHVGGAGTHYPRHDDNGKPMYPPNMHSPAKAFGPAPFIVVETPRDEESVGKVLAAIGFDGEWFDSHDVEQYLRELGLQLDGHSTFVDVDPSVATFPQLAEHATPGFQHQLSGTSDSSSETIDSPNPIQTPTPPPAISQSHPFPRRRSSYVQQMTSEDYAAEAPLNMDTTFASDGFFPLQDKLLNFGENQNIAMPGYSDARPPTCQGQPQDNPLSRRSGSKSSGMTRGNLPERSPRFSINLQTVGTSRREPMTVDVQRLLDKMVDRSVCLGRAPGFRRQDVNHALATALQEAF